jgi:hypothetical protein
MARVFENRVCGRDERIFHGPALGERGGIFNGRFIEDGIGVHARKAFHHMQALSGSVEIVVANFSQRRFTGVIRQVRLATSTVRALFVQVHAVPPKVQTIEAL